MKLKLVVADPPWKFANKKTGGSMKSGSASHYPVMSTQDICDIPVKSHCDRDSLLLLWVPTAMKEDGLRVVKAWGFEYVTTIYWVKADHSEDLEDGKSKVVRFGKLGMGHWFRNQVEEVWICRRGRPCSPFRLYKPNVFFAARGIHSEKPNVFFDILQDALGEEFVGMFPRVELFARRKRPGWISVGNAIDGKDVKEGLEQLSVKLEKL